jgi:hypothetical protein
VIKTKCGECFNTVEECFLKYLVLNGDNFQHVLCIHSSFCFCFDVHCMLIGLCAWTTEKTVLVFPADEFFYLLQNVQAGCGSHPTSYSVDTRDSLSDSKAPLCSAEVNSWGYTSIPTYISLCSA